MTTQANDPTDGARLSIGALARATGVPTETLRTWERRYGFPAPSGRTGSGHRYYALSAVEAVRVAVRALERGHRPQNVFRANPETRRVLAGLATPTTTAASVRRLAPPTEEAQIETWLEHSRAFLGEELTRGFAREWTRLGAVAFLDRAAAPFLEALGRAWAEGKLQVGHEHFATEHLRAFLSRHWRPLAEQSDVGIVVCATPPGERHVIGLHMAATVFALSGFGVVFLGADVPAEDVASAAMRSGADVVALSGSASLDRELARRYRRRVAEMLDDRVRLVVGGQGFVDGDNEVPSFRRLSTLDRWARTVAAKLAGSRDVAQ